VKTLWIIGDAVVDVVGNCWEFCYLLTAYISTLVPSTPKVLTASRTLPINCNHMCAALMT